MKHTKRLISVLLTLCMLLAAMPLTAFAEDCAHNYPYVCSTLCTLCGEVRTPEMEHTNYLSDCDETCGLCGEVRETTVPHESDGLPCVENVCKHCYAAIPATTDHTDEDGDYYCDVCWTWLGCDQGVHSRDGLPCQDTVCYYCGIEMPAEDHEIGGAAICVDNQCIYCGTSVPASADHNYQCYYEQEPTCVNDGKQYYECTQCYDRYTETIPTTGEHEDSDGDYWCDWCVLWLGCESGIHNRMHTILCMDSACSACGLAMPATEGHVSNNYACRDGWCVNGCDTLIPATADHTYDDAADPDCNVCGDEREIACVHEYDYDCDTACNLCGEVREPLTSHTPWYPCLDSECLACGEMVPAGVDHDDEDGDYRCNRCFLWLGCDSGLHDRTSPYACMDTYCQACGIDLPATESHESNNFDCSDGWCVNGCQTAMPAITDHAYAYGCSTNCYICGFTTRPEAECVSDDGTVYDQNSQQHAIAYYCIYCSRYLSAVVEEHTDEDGDGACDVCGESPAWLSCTHQYDYTCSTNCNLCGAETRPEAEHLSDDGTVYDWDETHHAIYYSCQHCGQTIDAIAEEHADEDGDGACDVCGYKPCVEHVYDSNFDAYCNVCRLYRDIDVPMDVLGVSVSEDVNGLAMIFTAQVEGLAFDGNRILYDNATIGGEKLIGLGAVVSNNYDEVGYVPSLEDVDGVRVLDVPIVYAYDYDEATGTLYFAVRVINIPDEHKDTTLVYSLYFIYENNLGEQEVYYPGAWGDSYNRVAGEVL